MITKRLAIALSPLLMIACGWAAAEGDVAAGKAKYAMCAGCHGANGVSVAPTFPTLAGKDAEYIKSALIAYKSGERQNAQMKAMASGLSEADIENLAAYIATFPQP